MIVKKRISRLAIEWNSRRIPFTKNVIHHGRKICEWEKYSRTENLCETIKTATRDVNVERAEKFDKIN